MNREAGHGIRDWEGTAGSARSYGKPTTVTIGQEKVAGELRAAWQRLGFKFLGLQGGRTSREERPRVEDKGALERDHLV